MGLFGTDVFPGAIEWYDSADRERYRSIMMRSPAHVLCRLEHRGIQNLKTHVTKTMGQGALLPSGGKVMLQLAPFTRGEMFEFHVRHHGATVFPWVETHGYRQ